MTYFKPRIYFALFALGVLLIGTSGCCPHGQDCSQGASSDDKPSQNIDRAHFVGWYKMGDMPIPVLKTDETYYSVCRGFEIPFKQCPDGLEWALTQSSMVGTKIGFDKVSNTYYIIVEDSMLANNYDRYVSGEKKPLTRTEKPSGLLDATAQPPHTNDDFLGWYLPAWLGGVFEIQKDGDRYFAAMPVLDGKTEEEPHELAPLADRLGFTGFDRKNKHSLTYNESLKRFELTKQTPSHIIRMPLVRFPSPPSLEELIRPPMRIGIPSWH